MAAKTMREKVSKLDLLDEMAGSLPLVSEKDYESKSVAIPSGSLTLDMAIGIGGLPRGAIIDVFGSPAAGKSLISIMAIAQVQKAGGVAVVWDAERSYSRNLDWMRVNGVDTSKLRFLKLRATQGGEIGFDAMEKILEANAADLIVVDSLPALVSQAALDKDMMDSASVAARAGMISRAMPRLAALADESKCCIMLINQMRANIGGGMYGPSEKETSILSVVHHSSVRLQVTKINKSMKIENDIPVGHRVRVKVVKNKVAAPYRQAEFELNYLKGVDNASEVVDILIGAGKIEAKGAWFYYAGEKFQGMDKLVTHFKDPVRYAASVEEVKSLTNVNAFGVPKTDTPALTVEELTIEGDQE
jgi:recombination protein RecA